jgi:hypothetical protein
LREAIGRYTEGMIIFSVFMAAAQLSLSTPAAAQAPIALDFDRGTPSTDSFLEAVRASAASMTDVPMSAAPAAAPASDAPPLPPGTPPKLVRPFQEAFAKAIQRLKNPKCAALYGAEGEGERQFRAVEYRYEKMGRPTLNSEGLPRVVGASTHAGTPASVFINSEGPFIQQNVYVNGRFQILDFETGLRGADFGGLLLLHELGHVVGIFGPDAKDSKLNRSYTQQVIDHCYR